MLIEWLRRRDAKLDEHLRTYLFRSGSIVELEHEAEHGDDAGAVDGGDLGHRLAQGGGGTVNHLHRDLAPISAQAWEEVENEVRRALRTFLTGRRLVDFSGPHGYAMSSLDLGRTSPAHEVPGEGVRVAIREAQPLVELRREFEIAWDELDAVDRGATSIDLAPAVEAARAWRSSRTGSCTREWKRPRSTASRPSRPTSRSRPPVGPRRFLPRPPVRSPCCSGPASRGRTRSCSGTRTYTEVVEGTEDGYPVLEHLRLVLEGGAVHHAPALDGALVVSLRGGDFELVVGEDLSLGYCDRNETGVRFFLEETMLFRVNSPEAAAVLAVDRG